MTVLVGTIQERKDTAANWTSANPVLLDGEYGLETDTKKRKLGDGVTAWTSLAYYSDPLAEQLANKGQANGYAPLNGSSQIPQQYLPSFVDDVLEFANLAAFPGAGETGKIYVAVDTGRQYRWSGSAYVAITNGFIASTDDVPEGTNNKYSTNNRVLNYVLTGLTAAASRVLPDAADSIITAWGKVLKYLTDLGTAAFLNVGTTAGTVAAGDDARFDNATTPVVFHDDGGYNRNPADASTYYLKTHITQGAVTTSSQGNGVRFRCPRNLTFVAAQINAHFTFGSSEATTFTINNVTAGTSQTITSTANYSAPFSTNHSFSFSCSENDYIEVRMVCPTWATNPTTLNQIVTIYYQ